MLYTYKFKLYKNSKKERYLCCLNCIACDIWNHCIALSQRFYRLFKKTINFVKLQSHISKLIKTEKYVYWKKLPSQTRQDVVQRIQKAYQKFFRDLKNKIKTKPPKFKKYYKYKSITFKTNTSKNGRICVGFRLEGGTNRIRIGNYTYKFFKHREIQGEIKTLTVKKDSVGDWYIYLVCETNEKRCEINSPQCNVEGFDFGLKDFLTASSGQKIQPHLFFENSSTRIAALSRSLNRKRKQNKKVSNNYKKVRAKLARLHRKIVNCRNDYQFKLAKSLAESYDVLIFESLNLEEMKRKFHFGKKLSDLAFYSFLSKLETYCAKYNKQFIKIDRWFPSSKKCFDCGYINKDLKLSDRQWTCPQCGQVHDRDINAAKNIKREGTASLGLGPGGLRPPLVAT